MGRQHQPFAPGLFIREWLLSLPDLTDYPEHVHHFYKQTFRAATADQVSTLLAAIPGLENRFREVVTPAGETRYRLLTKPKPYRPSRPYHLARYAAFSHIWHILVRLGALEYVIEMPAMGRINPEDEFRIQDETLTGVSRWQAVRLDKRPVRHYYRLTEAGQRMAEGVWRNPRGYEQDGIPGIVDTYRIGYLAPRALPPPLTIEELRERLEGELLRLDEIASRANEEIGRGIPHDQLLASTGLRLDSTRAELQTLINDYIAPAAVTDRRVRELAERAEAIADKLLILTNVLAPAPEGMVQAINTVGSRDMGRDEFVEIVHTFSYQGVANEPLVTLLFYVPVPARAPADRDPRRAAELAWRRYQETIPLLIAFQSAIQAGRQAEAIARRRQAMELLDTAVRQAATALVRVPARTEAEYQAYARTMWIIALVKRFRDITPGLLDILVGAAPEDRALRGEWDRLVARLRL